MYRTLFNTLLIASVYFRKKDERKTKNQQASESECQWYWDRTNIERESKRILKPRIYNNAVILSTFIYNKKTVVAHIWFPESTTYAVQKRDFWLMSSLCEKSKRNDINTFACSLSRKSFLYFFKASFRNKDTHRSAV